MAETTEKIIFSVQIDQSDAIAKVAGLTKEIDSLKEANKQLSKAEGDNTKAIAENNVLIQLATKEKSAMNKAIVASVEAFNNESKSIDNARASVKQLTIERNKLDLSTTEGKKKQKELNASIDEHNEFIKENVDQYQQQKINIGNYSSALSGLKGPVGNAINQLVSMKDGFDLAADGIKSADINMKSLSGVFKANIFGLVTVALGGLIAVFSKFEPIIEKVEFIMGGISQAADVLISRFIDVGKAIVNMDFTNFGLNLKGVAGEMKNAYNEGYKLAQMLDEIEERQTDGVIAQSKYERAVASLNVQLKNKTKTQAELIAISDKIAILDKQEIDRKLQIADLEVKRLAKLNTNAIKEQTITEEMRVAFVNAYAAREKIQQEYEVATERRENRVDAINQKFQAKRDSNDAKRKANNEKLIADLKKQEESLNDLLQQAIDLNEDNANKELDRKRELAKQNIQVNQERKQSELNDLKDIAASENETYQDRRDALDELYNKQIISKEDYVNRVQQLDQAEINSATAVAQAAQGVISQLAASAEQGSEIQKALALTNVAINLGTAIGNLTATTTSAASVDNVLTGGVAGFVKYAAFLAQVTASITSARNIIGGAAAGGGDFMTTGPTLLLVGDNPGGRERVKVEPISGKGQTTINPNSGLVAMAGGGTLTTAGYGGFAERNGSVKSMIDYNELAKAFANQPAPVLQITELNRKQSDLSKVSKKVNLVG